MSASNEVSRNPPYPQDEDNFPEMLLIPGLIRNKDQAAYYADLGVHEVVPMAIDGYMSPHHDIAFFPESRIRGLFQRIMDAEDAGLIESGSFHFAKDEILEGTFEEAEWEEALTLDS